MIVWCVEGDCKDFYCEGQHTLAVCSTKELAEEIGVKSKAKYWDITITAVELDEKLR